jgi:hypothetical protein
MRHGLGRAPRRPVLFLVAVLLAVMGGLAFAGGTQGTAHAASGVGTVADALKRDPVYVDPGAAGQLSSAQAKTLSDKIKDANKPVFVAVLPATSQFPPQTVLQDVRSAVGITGVYAIHLGDRFNAGADPQVMSQDAVRNLVGEVQRATGPSNSQAAVNSELTSFVDQAVKQAKGTAPDSWSGGSTDGTGSYGPGGSGAGAGYTAVVVLGIVMVAAIGGGLALRRRQRTLRDRRDRVQLEQLRTVVDEDITAYGEELDRLDFHPGDPAADDAMRADYTHALDAYETAKVKMDRARRPDDVRPVTESLEDGRFALATLAARRAGEPLPERRPPCFFDPRHGPSVRDVPWAPPGGVPRDVPACAADATRIDDGDEPMAREVQTASGPQPYWNAGPMYGPWAGGYFGGGLLPGLLVGTLLGGTFAGPGWGYGGYGYGDDGSGGGDGPGGPDGGDYSGSDFDPGDFGGGGWGDGGGGGFGDGGGF